MSVNLNNKDFIMADDKKKLSGHDEFDLGEEFDFDSFDNDFGSQSNVKPGDPNQRVVADFTAGAKDAVESMIKAPDLKAVGDFAKDALPYDVKWNMDGLFELPSKVSETVEKNIGPLKQELRETGRIINSFLPKGGKLEEWMKKIDSKLAGDEETAEARESKEQQQAAAIAGAITEAMGDMQARQQAAETIRTQVETQQYANTNNILIKLLGSSESLRHFNNEVTDKYFRKSLELQFQQLYTAKEQTEILKVGVDTIKAQLENVIKNTSLPDLIKLRNSEQLKETLKNRFREGVADTLYGDWNPLVRFQKNITNKIRDFMQGATDQLSMMNSGLGMLDSLDGMEELGMTKSRMAGEMAMSGFILDPLRQKLAGKVGTAFGNTFVGKKLFTGMRNMGADFTQFVGDAYNSSKGNKSLVGRGVNKLLGLTKGFTSNNYMKTVDFQREDLRQPVAFDGITRASIVKVIPSLLNKIYGEIASIRTSKGIKEVSKDFDMVYDFDKGQHVSSSTYTTTKIDTYKKKAIAKAQWPIDDVIDKLAVVIPALSTNSKVSNATRSVLKTALINYLIDNGGISTHLPYDNRFIKYVDEEEKKHGKRQGLAKVLKNSKKYLQPYFESDGDAASSFLRSLKDAKASLIGMNQYMTDLHLMGRMDLLDSMTGAGVDYNTGKATRENVVKYNEGYGQYYQDASATREWIKENIRDGEYDREGYTLKVKEALRRREEAKKPYEEAKSFVGERFNKVKKGITENSIYQGIAGTAKGLSDVAAKHTGKAWEKFNKTKMMQNPEVRRFMGNIAHALDQSPELTMQELEQQAKDIKTYFNQSGLGRAVQEGEVLKFLKEQAKEKGKLIKTKAADIYSTKIKTITPSQVVAKIKQLTDKETILATGKDLLDKLKNAEITQDIASLPEIDKLNKKLQELKGATGEKAEKLKGEIKVLMAKHAPKINKKLEELEQKGFKGTAEEILNNAKASKAGGWFTGMYNKFMNNELVKKTKDAATAKLESAENKLREQYDKIKDKNVGDAVAKAGELSNKAKGKLVAFYKDPIGSIKKAFNLKDFAIDIVAKKTGLPEATINAALNGDQAAMEQLHTAVQNYHKQKGEVAKAENDEKKNGYRIPGRGLAYSATVDTIARILRVTHSVDRWIGRKIRSGIGTGIKLLLKSPLLILKAPWYALKGIWRAGKFIWDIRKRMSVLDQRANAQVAQDAEEMQRTSQALTGEQGIIGRLLTMGFTGVMEKITNMSARVGSSTDAVAEAAQTTLEAKAAEVKDKMEQDKKKEKEEKEAKAKAEKLAKEKANADKDGSGSRDGSAKDRRGMFAKLKNAGSTALTKLKEVKDQHWGKLLALAGAALMAIKDVREAVWGAMKWMGKKAWEGTKWLAGKAWEGIKWLGKAAWDGLKAMGNDLLNKVSFGLLGKDDKKTKGTADTARGVANVAVAGAKTGLLGGIWKGVKAIGGFALDTFGGPVGRLARSLLEKVSGAGTKLVQAITKKLSAKVANTLIGKFAAKIVPGVGWALLGYDLCSVAYYMIHDKMPFLSALSKAFIGFDIFGNDTPVDPETGEKLETLEETKAEADKINKENKGTSKPVTINSNVKSIGKGDETKAYELNSKGEIIRTTDETSDSEKLGNSNMSDEDVYKRGLLSLRSEVDALRDLNIDPIKLRDLNKRIIQHNTRWLAIAKQKGDKVANTDNKNYLTNPLEKLYAVLRINQPEKGKLSVIFVYKNADGTYEEQVFDLLKSGKEKYEEWLADTIKYEHLHTKGGLVARARSLFMVRSTMLTSNEWTTRRAELMAFARGDHLRPNIKEKKDQKAPGTAPRQQYQPAEQNTNEKITLYRPNRNNAGNVNNPGQGAGYMPGNLTGPAVGANQSQILAMLDDVARKFGIDPFLFKAVAAQESGLNPAIKPKNGASSATGLFQFTNATWKAMIAKYGKQYGYTVENTQPTDALANAIMAAHYFKEHEQAVKGVVSNPSGVHLYLAHFLGDGGAKAFLKRMIANPNEPAHVGVGAASVKANPAYFAKGLTKSELLNTLAYKLQDKAGQFKIGVSNGGVGSTVFPTPDSNGMIPNLKQDIVVPTDMTLEEAKQINNSNRPGTNGFSHGYMSAGTGYNAGSVGNANTYGGNNQQPVNNTNYQGGVDFKGALANESAGAGMGGALMLPTASNVVTSRFGPRDMSKNKGGGSSWHKGIDLRAGFGQPIRAMKDGVVKFAGGPYGTVEVDHGDGYVSKYLHLQSIGVRVGQFVKAGDYLGAAGGRGPRGAQQYNPHLHLTILKNGVPVDPEKVLRAGGVGLQLKGGGNLPPLSDAGAVPNNANAVPTELTGIKAGSPEFDKAIEAINNDPTLLPQDRVKKIQQLRAAMNQKPGGAAGGSMDSTSNGGTGTTTDTSGNTVPGTANKDGWTVKTETDKNGTTVTASRELQGEEKEKRLAERQLELMDTLRDPSASKEDKRHATEALKGLFGIDAYENDDGTYSFSHFGGEEFTDEEEKKLVEKAGWKRIKDMTPEEKAAMKAIDKARDAKIDAKRKEVIAKAMARKKAKANANNEAQAGVSNADYAKKIQELNKLRVSKQITEEEYAKRARELGQQHIGNKPSSTVASDSNMISTGKMTKEEYQTEFKALSAMRNNLPPEQYKLRLLDLQVRAGYAKPEELEKFKASLQTTDAKVLAGQTATEQRPESAMANNIKTGESAIDNILAGKEQYNREQAAAVAQAGTWEASKTNTNLSNIDAILNQQLEAQLRSAKALEAMLDIMQKGGGLLSSENGNPNGQAASATGAHGNTNTPVKNGKNMDVTGGYSANLVANHRYDF